MTMPAAVDLNAPARFGVTVREQVPLAAYTTMKVGGPAEYFAAVATVDQLIRLVRWAREDHVAIAGKWRALRVQLQAIADGESDALGAEDVANFTARNLSHIDREDNELLPYAAQLLTAEDLTAFSANMKARRRVFA